ncbi:hypothetical protein [Nocardia suismassiliense]|uniref:hypothetical protein n=1 Tax=Nocardia suismassiliense TaxID=2077092 RepID=UPI00131EE573|nr:hypothetical protein [Nocardia suismassiliense]
MNLFRTADPAAQGRLTGRSAGFIRTLLLAVASMILMITGVQAAGAAQANYQPCTNYRVTTNWGRVEVDTRPAGTDYIGNIAWAMFINDISHVPGRYDYQIRINGTPLKTETIHKDDNLHFTIPRYQGGRYVYDSGDEIQVTASHAAGKHLYVTPINRCTVPYSGG